MTGNPDRLIKLAKMSKLPADRIRYVPDAGEEFIRSSHRVVLFLMAFWSGPARQAFVALTETIAKLDIENRLELVVVDVDGSPELYEAAEFEGKVHGYGEKAWIRDRKIIATSGMGLNTACFEPNTLALLAAP
jgi:hypothetical protein